MKERKKNMTTPALPHEPNDLENTFLRDNSRKKSYAEALQEDRMHDSIFEAGDGDREEQPHHESDFNE